MTALLFEVSVLHAAKELDGRGTVFGFDLLGVSDDDRPDAPQLGDRIGVVVDAQVVVHPRLAGGRHEKRRRLLAAFVAAGRLPRPERQEETLREVPPLAVIRAERAGHRPNDVGAGQHVARDRERVAVLVTAPRNAARPGVAERALGVQTVNLTDVAITVLPEEGTQCDVHRHTLSEQCQSLTPELGVHARLGGDRPPSRDPRYEAAYVGPRRGHGDAERARFAVTRGDREGMKINHLFKLYHGRPAHPPDYLGRLTSLCRIRDLGASEPGKVTDLTLSGPRRCGEYLEY